MKSWYKCGTETKDTKLGEREGRRQNKGEKKEICFIGYKELASIRN